jgi:hypothetical protein
MKLFLPVVLIATSALASCATTPAKPTPQSYAAAQTMLEGSPGIRKLVQNKCATDMATLQQKQVMSLLANVPQDRVARVVCERLIKAMASGRLTYSDFTQTLDRHPTVTAVKVVQGR